MARWLLSVMALGWLWAPAHAVTEQEIVDGLGDDLAAVVVPLQRIVPKHQLTLTASLDLVGDRAQLDTNLALRALAVDLALASAALSRADKDAAPVARQQYLIDISQAIAKYQQALAQAYNGWTNGATQAYQAGQQSGPAGLQTGLQALATAQQRASQAMAGMIGDDGAPLVQPTLPDLTGRVGEDSERLAEAAFVIGEARRAYLTDVNELMAACDEALAAAVDADPETAETMAQLLKELNQASCRRYLQYEADVRQTLATICQTCGAP
ncbi:MAG: hypothetical protein FJX74_11275 [Armatimonadetes bacterium]|nr:hypothetical protein [Armatimonadota bacterium]